MDRSVSGAADFLLPLAAAANAGRSSKRHSRRGKFPHAPRPASAASRHRGSESGLAPPELDFGPRGGGVLIAFPRPARRQGLAFTFRLPGLFSVGRGSVAGAIREFC